MRGLLRVAFLPILGKRIISIDMKGSSMNIRDFMLALLLMWPVITEAQPFSFAHVTDTHVGGSTGAEDLERTVRDLNAQAGIDFVLVTGDVTEFGSREELEEARRILDGLQKPWYAVPGNHDSKWSESGCNDFVQVFGAENFVFEKGGLLFIGTASGPNMRMAPALVPREQLLWLDSVLTAMKDPVLPVIFINHYPLDASMSNSGKVLELLKSRNVRVSLMGHGHNNKLFDFGGLPGVMARSNLRAGRETGGYNIVTVTRDTLFFAERVTGRETLPVWCKIPLKGNPEYSRSPEVMKEWTEVPVPTKIYSTSASGASAPVRVMWEVTDPSDIGAGVAARGNIAVYTRTDGHIVARDLKDGRVIWTFRTGGKLFSTPAIRGNKVVCPSTDGHIRCLDLKDGSLLWDFPTSRPIVASPVIGGQRVFTGSSEGVFRANRLKDGAQLWQYDSVRNFVETRPLLYRGAVYFGSWGNSFYALDQKNGALQWTREKYANRMLSPAAVWPVAARGKIFIVAPDRRMTALDAATGREIWDSGKWSCRESIGISGDKKEVYIKNMTEGNVLALETRCDSQKVVWECEAGLGYEIAPSPVTQKGDLLFVPTTSGVIYAIDRKENRVVWKYQAGEALINHILPVGGRRLLVTTFDGKVVCLRY